MANRAGYQFRLRVWPQEATPRFLSHPFAFNDTMSDLLLRDRGSGSEDAASWAQQSEFNLLGSALRLLRFSGGQAKEGTDQAAKQGTGFGALALKPQEVWTNLQMQGDTFRAPTGDGTRRTIRCRAIKGERWRTAQGDRSPRVTGVYHAQQTPNQDVTVETIDYLEANQQIRLDLSQLQIAIGQTQKARIRIEFGGRSLVLRQDNYATLERRTRDGKGWEEWKPLTETGKLTMEEDLIVRIERAGGRCLVSIGDKTWDAVEVAQEPGGAAKPVEVKWPRYRLRVTFYGVTARMELALLNFAHLNELLKKLPPRLSKFEGAVTTSAIFQALGVKRTLRREGRGPLGESRTLKTTGWAYNGALMPSGFRDLSSDEGSQAVSYAVVLFPSPDGHETPLLIGAQGYIEGVYEAADVEPLDLTPAYISHSATTAEPGANNGAEYKFEVSRSVLRRLYPEWTDTIFENGYNTAAFSVRAAFDDGSFGPWVTRIKGVVWQIDKKTDDVEADGMSLSIQDLLCRLNTMKVDQEYFPAMSVLVTDTTRRELYAGQVMQEILRIALGDVEAGRMNGDGDPLRYSPPNSHFPLLSPSGDAMGVYLSGIVPIKQGFPLMPPYWDTIVSWLRQLAKDDTGGYEISTFYYGYATGTGENTSLDDEDVWPCFIYGDIRRILADRNQWTISDAVYEAGDQNRLMEDAETQSRPENDYNEWIVTNTFPGADAGLLGAHQVGRARLPIDDPRRPELSWPRQAVVKMSTLFTTADNSYVGAIADALAAENTGVSPLTPQFTFRGEPQMQWGDLLFIKQLNITNTTGDVSDFEIPVNMWFRIMRLEESGKAEDSTYEMKAVCAVLSASERTALGLTG